jgi:hypothetical protein
MFNNFFLGNLAFNEIILKKNVEKDKLQSTTWHMRIVRWIPKATKTHTQTYTENK